MRLKRLSTKWVCWKWPDQEFRTNILSNSEKYYQASKSFPEGWERKFGSTRMYTHTHTHIQNCSNNLNKLFQQKKKNYQRPGHFLSSYHFQEMPKKAKIKDATTVFSCARPAATTLTGHCCLKTVIESRDPSEIIQHFTKRGELISFIWNEIPTSPDKATTDGEEVNSF